MNTEPSPGPNPLAIGLVVFPRCQPAGLFAIADLLALLNHKAGRELFRPVWVTHGGPVAVSWQNQLLRDAVPLETVDCGLWVVPPLWATDVDQLKSVLNEALPVSEELATRQGRFWTYCSGSLILAQSGKIDGRRMATERWLVLLAGRLFPSVKWDAESGIAHDGEFSSAAGLHGYFRILSEWIAQTMGLDVLRTLEAGQFLPIPSRESGAFRPVDETVVCDPRLRRLLEAAKGTPADRIDLAWACGLLDMSSRSFFRFVADKTDMTPGEWLRRIKLRQVGRLLATTDTPLREISKELGYQSQAGLTRSFQQATGYTPQQYRKLFGELEFSPPVLC